MAGGTGLPIPKSGDVLTQPISVIDGDQYTSARDWANIAQTGAKLADAAGDVMAKAEHQQQIGYLADQDTEIGRKRADLRNQFANDPEGFDAAWKGYTDGKLGEAAPWAVPHVRRMLGTEGNGAYSAILSERRARDTRLSAEKIAGLATQSGNDVIGAAMAGTLNTPDGQIKIEKYRSVLDSAVNSDLHSKEWADAHMDDTLSKAHGEEAARSGVDTYRKSGFDAAVQHLRSSILENDNLTMSPAAKYTAFNRGMQAVRLAKQEDAQDRAGIVQIASDLRARIESGQVYDSGEVRDAAGALSRVGAWGEHRKLVVADAVRDGTRGASLPELAAAATGRRSAVVALPASVAPIVDEAARSANIDPGFFRRVAQIESGGNPQAVTGSYKGLFQLSDAEFKAAGGSNIYDPRENATIAAAKMRREIEQFRQSSGRDPSPTEIYLQHQQGVGGLAAHLANPDGPAWQNMASTAEGRQKGEAWAKAAIWGNVPDNLKPQLGSVENVTSRQFIDLWRGKVEGGAGAPDERTMLQAPYAGQIAKVYQERLVKDARAAWPQMKGLIEKGEAIDPEDFGAIRDAAAMSGDQKFIREVEGAELARRYGKLTETLTEPERQAALDQLRAGLPQSGMPVSSQQLIDNAVTKQFERQNKQVREDPVGYHIEKGGAPPDAINVGNSVAFRDALRQRSQIVQGVAKDQGVPIGSALRDTEIATVKAALATPDLAAKARIYSDMQAALPQDVYMATLAKIGQGSPESMLDAFVGGLYQASPEIAKSVLQGRQAIKTDERYAKDDTDHKEALDKALPATAFTVRGATDPTGPYATMRSAVWARYADLSAQSGDVTGKVNTSRLDQAVNDITGGIVSFNGTQIVAPERGMTQERFDSIMFNLTNADLAGVGTMGGDIVSPMYLRRNARLQSIGDGRYLVQLGTDPTRPIYAMKFDVSGEATPFVLDLKDKPTYQTSPSILSIGKSLIFGRDFEEWWQQGGPESIQKGVEAVAAGAQRSHEYLQQLFQDISDSLVSPAEAAPKFKLRPGMRGFTTTGEAAWSAEREAIYRTMVKTGERTQDIVEKTGMPEHVVRERMMRKEFAIANMYTESPLIELFKTRRRTESISADNLIKFTESLPAYDLSQVMQNIPSSVYEMYTAALARQAVKDSGGKAVDMLKALDPEVYERVYKGVVERGKVGGPPFGQPPGPPTIPSDNLAMPKPPTQEDLELMSRLGIKGMNVRRVDPASVGPRGRVEFTPRGQPPAGIEPEKPKPRSIIDRLLNRPPEE